MTNEYYGATRDAENTINSLLGLPANGDEQDWEFELADPSKIDRMIEVLAHEQLDLECKSALALLLISSIQDAEELGMLRADQMRGVTELLLKDGNLLSRMHFYWIELKKSRNVELLDDLITGQIEQ